MPQIAQQDYKVIAPKRGRAFGKDAAALAELKKSILNSIGFDCILKNVQTKGGTLNRILGFFEDGSSVSTYDSQDVEIVNIDLPYTVTQYQGLAAVQNAEDKVSGATVEDLPLFERTSGGYLNDYNVGFYICVDGKYLTVTGDETIEALAISETGPTEDFVNITWEDAQKLIGLPLV